MRTLVDLLAEHGLAVTGIRCACACGFELPNDYRVVRAHAEHQAAAVRVWLTEALAAPEVVEAAHGEFMRPEHGCDGATLRSCESICPVPAYEVKPLDELIRAALLSAADALRAGVTT